MSTLGQIAECKGCYTWGLPDDLMQVHAYPDVDGVSHCNKQHIKVYVMKPEFLNDDSILQHIMTKVTEIDPLAKQLTEEELADIVKTVLEARKRAIAEWNTP